MRNPKIKKSSKRSSVQSYLSFSKTKLAIAVLIGLGASQFVMSSLASSRTTVSKQFGMTDASIAELAAGPRAAALDDIKSTGMGWLRTDIAWSTLQPNRGGAYNWAHYDPVMRDAAARNINVLAILDYTPAWAAASNCNLATSKCPPANNAEFNTFVRDTVRHYKAMGVHTWEIWNEPNTTGFWGPAANAANYTALLKMVYPTIKSIDSSATVITAGLAPAVTADGNMSPEDFISGVYAAGGKAYFDAVGAHPYCFPASPNDVEDWSGWTRMVKMHDIMVANGDSSKKVWMTEFGAPTGGPGAMATVTDRKYDIHPDHVDEDFQNYEITAAVAKKKSYSWAGPLFIYQYRDMGTSTVTNENFYGLLRYDSSRKPAYYGLKSAIAN